MRRLNDQYPDLRLRRNRAKPPLKHARFFCRDPQLKLQIPTDQISWVKYKKSSTAPAYRKNKETIADCYALRIRESPGPNGRALRQGA
jgi:hypothetical protein